MWEECGRQPPKTRIDRQKSCPEQLSSDLNASRRLEVKGSGKRFARRAKRWAELQQRRQVARTCIKSDLGFDVYRQQLNDPMELALGLPLQGDESRQLDENFRLQNHHLKTQRSFSYTPLQPLKRDPHIQFNRETNDLFISSCIVGELHQPPPMCFYQSYKASFPLNSAIERSQNVSTTLKETAVDTINLLTTDFSSVGLASDEEQISSLSTSNSSRNSESEELSQVFSHTLIDAQKCSIFDKRLSLSRSLGATQTQHQTIVNTVPPPERNWVMIRHADPDRPIATFTVLCYNVLCDKYATATAYSYCPSWALNWEYRKNAIMKEIRNYEADIVTLQEVETEQFKLLFNPELKALGYASVFSPKSRAKTMNDEEKKYVDGCAIFWKSDKFELERDWLIEFTQVAMRVSAERVTQVPVQKAQSSEHMLNRVMPRDNIALCAVLRVKDNVYNNRRLSMSPGESVVGCPLVVCTAHIHWDPEFCDVKLVQSIMLTSELNRLLQEVSDKFRMHANQIPVLICGDLNSLPDSGVFEFLSKGHISRNHLDLKQFKEDPILEKFSISADSTVYGHTLRLDSSVDTSSVPFTNYTLDFKGVIDYIFSTPQSLARLGVLGPFDMPWIQQNKIIGFPHPHVPSDHIPIMAQYAIIPSSHQQQHPNNSKVNTVNHLGLNNNSASYGSHGFGQLNFGR